VSLAPSTAVPVPAAAPTRAPAAVNRVAEPAARSATVAARAASAAVGGPAAEAGPPVRALPTDPGAWPAFVASLRLGGIAGQLAAQTALLRCTDRELVLGVPDAQRHLTDKVYADKLKAALDEATGTKVRLAFEVSAAEDSSLAAQARRERAEHKARTEAQFRDEPFVRDVVARFDATINPDSIKPVS
jgi:DNA polymerase-3 subunit gamma/tau